MGTNVLYAVTVRKETLDKTPVITTMHKDYESALSHAYKVVNERTQMSKNDTFMVKQRYNPYTKEIQEINVFPRNWETFKTRIYISSVDIENVLETKEKTELINTNIINI